MVGGTAAGPMDLSAPPFVWLQVDTDGDNEDRSEAIPPEAWDHLSWHYESIGGQEVRYIREDLATLSAQPRGEVVITRDEDGEIVAVTRQNEDGQILKVLASTTHAGGKTQPASAPVGVEKFESRLRGRAGPFTAQPGERYVDADIALAVLREALAHQPRPDDVARLVEAATRVADDWQRNIGNGTGLHLAMYGEKGSGDQLLRALVPFTAAQQEAE